MSTDAVDAVVAGVFAVAVTVASAAVVVVAVVV